MPLLNRPLVRVAVAMYADLVARRANGPLVDLPVATWDRCAVLVHRFAGRSSAAGIWPPIK